jgi:hypothetical protein
MLQVVLTKRSSGQKREGEKCGTHGKGERRREEEVGGSQNNHAGSR